MEADHNYQVTERPQLGKANKQLIRYLAQLFDVPVEDVILVSGRSGTRKVVLLSNAVAEEVESIITKAITNDVS